MSRSTEITATSSGRLSPSWATTMIPRPNQGSQPVSS
jgi:hypothetical protein